MVVMEHKVKCLGNDGLQGHQPSAQGNTLGNSNRQIYNTPCKGKSFMHLRLFFWPFRPNSSLQGIVQISLVLLLLRSSFALSGRVFHLIIQTTGRCPGLRAHWPFRPFEYKYTCET